MGTPQEVTFDNWNQTTAFRGHQETQMNVVLTPTLASDEHSGRSDNGYRTHIKKISPGSVVNK